MRYFIFCLAFFTLLAVFASQLTFGQDLTGNTAVIEIKGTVLDSANRKPIEIAIVSIWVDGKVIASAVTDQAGKFQLVTTEPAPKEILVSFIGYENYKSPLEGRSQTLEIQLRSKDLSLTEVVISGKKTLLQTSGDKMIYNASADISNKAGSASDVLRKVPLLTVGIDGEVKMRGNSNLKVLLNGMSSGIMAKNLKEALTMIPASSITSIEVITSPSAKYEAEGAAGVINIITKKNILGTSGNLNISGGNLEQSINASMNIARDKFDYSFNLNGSGIVRSSREHPYKTCRLSGRYSNKMMLPSMKRVGMREPALLIAPTLHKNLAQTCLFGVVVGLLRTPCITVMRKVQLFLNITNAVAKLASFSIMSWQ